MNKNRFHFLNVKNGDCSIIEHASGNVSMIDVCNARLPENKKAMDPWALLKLQQQAELQAVLTEARKNYGQKAHPENPIEYLEKFGIDNLFRFAVTHPDMDHMDGIADLFEYCIPTNYYDTANNKEIEGGWDGSPYRQEDWELYKDLRDSPKSSSPKCLRVFSGDNAAYRRKDWDGNPPGDSFYTLAPDQRLVEEGNESGDYNDSSYVFMFSGPAGKILLSGDSHDKTWEHILNNHESLVKDIDLLIAPHHGRKSDRSYEFLNVLNPKMTFFGNAESKHLAYSAWRSRGLEYITNNMAGSMIVDCDVDMNLYVTNESYARDENEKTFYCNIHQGWFVKAIAPSLGTLLASMLANS